jgi:hypothetical protein
MIERDEFWNEITGNPTEGQAGSGDNIHVGEVLLTSMARHEKSWKNQLKTIPQ